MFPLGCHSFGLPNAAQHARHVRYSTSQRLTRALLKNSLTRNNNRFHFTHVAEATDRTTPALQTKFYVLAAHEDERNVATPFI